MRLFASIAPPPGVVDHLASALQPVRLGAGPGFRWTDPAQWHLTLAFHGEVPDGAVDDVADHLAHTAATHPPLDLHLRGAGSFTGRTLWIGVGGDTRALTDLMAACELPGDPGTEDREAEPRRARRRAHMTVARYRDPDRRAGRRRGSGAGRVRGGRPGEPAAPEEVHDIVHALSVYSGPGWTASTVELRESRLGEGRSGGPLHRTVASFPLVTRSQ